MVDASKRIISSDRKDKLCKKATEIFPYQEPEEGFRRSTAVQENQHVTLLTKQLPYYNYTICGVIDTEKRWEDFIIFLSCGLFVLWLRQWSS